LTGLEAISAHNGWNIAIVGISIVFTGLTVLSLTIAQLHKILDFLENGGRKKQKQKTDMPVEPVCIILPQDIQESAHHFKLLIDYMGQPFPLPKLLEFAEKCGLKHPHSTLNDLILSGAIEPDDKGYYLWNKNVSY
jgi:hypothetical protein